jgi:hypothetical protein
MASTSARSATRFSPSTIFPHSWVASTFALCHEVSRLSVHHTGLCDCAQVDAVLMPLVRSFMVVSLVDEA